MNRLYGDISRLLTHGTSGEVIAKHYFNLMDISDDIRGKKLYDNV